MNLIGYSQALSEQHTRLLETASHLLRAEIPELEGNADVLILTTGSDGRGEKRWEKGDLAAKGSSPIELIVVSEGGIDPELLKKIQSVAEKCPLFFSQVEEKTLKHHSLIATDKKLCPMRATDAVVVLGNPALFEKYERIWREQVRQEGNYQKFANDFPRKYRVELGKAGERKEHLDLEQGILRHDGKYCQGPKYLHLRAVQTQICHIFCKALREREDTSWSEGFPKSIVDRIKWLKDRELLGDYPVERVQHAYLQALHWHHELQSVRDRQEPPVSIRVSSEELQAVTQELNDFLQSFKGKSK